MVINRESKVQNVAASATKILRLPPSSQRNAIFPQTFKAGRGGLGTRLRVTSYNLHCVGLVDFDDQQGPSKHTSYHDKTDFVDNVIEISCAKALLAKAT